MEQKQLLVQSVNDLTVTILQGEVPVIEVSPDDPWPEVVAAVNFLRSGARAVQLVLDLGFSSATESFTKFRQLAGDLARSVGEEQFRFSPDEIEREADRPHAVVMMTRTVMP